MTDASVRFTVLGPVRVLADEGPLDVGGATARAVLAVLLLRGEAGAGVVEIISSVWGSPGGATRDSAYHYVSGLRKVLNRARVDAVLESRRPRYRLLVNPNTVDWHRFRRLLAQARTERDRHEPQQAAVLLREALNLWRGDPLSDVGDRLGQLRRDMTEQRLVAVEILAAIKAQQGQPDEVARLLRHDVMSGPLREGAAALLIDALTALGRRDDAGEIYRRVHRRLADEYGLEPGEQLQAAHQRAVQSAGTTIPVHPPPRMMPIGDRPISGLPRPDRHFTNREHELNRILDAVQTASTAPICAIYGMGGAGKTALAVRAARALQNNFPDGVIFLDLQGYAEQGSALTPAETLDRLVRRMRVDVAAIPTDFDDLVAFYHDLLDGRRLLLVLDNAHDATQVRPALPRSGGCAAFVTSRRRLSALDDALMLPLDVLTPHDATKLFQAVAGVEKLRDESAVGHTLRRIINLCGRLPLAIRIAAARLRSSADYSLPELEANLSAESGRLDELEDDDRSVVASLQVSLNDLPHPVARTFLLLGLHLDGSFDAYAAAAVADIPEREAARHLRHLADWHLTAGHSPGRFQFHDLVAVFARQHASIVLPPAERTEALHRLADYFLRTAEIADHRITPHRYRVQLNLLNRTVAVAPLPDYDTALRWLTTEEDNLLRVCLDSAAAGLDEVCWQMAYTLRGYYFLTKRWQPWTATHEAALVASRRCGDHRAEAMIANNLGLAHLEQHAPQLAAGYYQQARELFNAIGDEHGEHTACANLAWLHYEQRDFQRFLDEMRPVYDFYRREHSERNAAITLRGIGLAEAELGRTSEAITDLLAALEVFERIGLRMDAAMTFNALGELYQRTGDTRRAVQALDRAITAAQRSGSTFETARAHHRLGQLAAAAGNAGEARRQMNLALEGYHALRASQADQVRNDLATLTRGR
ncbi:BTAD domain-containing putative transcriptional regulator [Micromonospora sp. WMMA1949]|uniref:AfsR/SARP family transcriptional regulator n=1 Tax=Micromonospora sp. WMMA1949 TaxID=3015162 RepID=UPI0022B6F355|nr:BTAD domain-containing putative transcriptional regulator [Micromonospora sp. WMMA1949]MCZ7424141.1 BTAD domain-containing putative transcriptional regulator [Micromonospora sp. WMMA1949]